MERNRINYTIKVHHGENSRITKKILKHLKQQKELLKVTSLHTPLHLRTDRENHVYEHYINFIDKEHPNKLQTVRNEIIAAIPDLFPVNYLFIFEDHFTTAALYGYRLEFTCYGIDDGHFHVYTKIKEQKAKSTPITSYKIQV